MISCCLIIIPLKTRMCQPTSPSPPPQPLGGRLNCAVKQETRHLSGPCLHRARSAICRSQLSLPELKVYVVICKQLVLANDHPTSSYILFHSCFTTFERNKKKQTDSSRQAPNTSANDSLFSSYWSSVLFNGIIIITNWSEP